jgi:hypothetical protein
MSTLRLVAVLSLLTLPARAFGDGKPTVWIKTTSGCEVTGTIAQDAIKINCELGELEIPVGKIKALGMVDIPGFTPDGKGKPILTPGVTTSFQEIKTLKEDRIVGGIMEPLRIESDLGVLTIGRDSIREIKVIEPASVEPKKEAPAPRPGPQGEAKPGQDKARGSEGEPKAPPSARERAARPSPIPRTILRPSASRVTKLKAPVAPRRPIRMANQAVRPAR